MKIIFFLFLNISFLFSAIDERRADIYFANGISTKQKVASENSLLLERKIIQTYGLTYYNNSINTIAYAYNHTNGKLPDLGESLLQKIGWQGLTDLLTSDHGRDLEKQITRYKESILSGHKVLVVAHSQGNLFTGEAYAALEAWMKPYFEAISIASPMSADIKENTPRIDWDNDLVARIATYGTSDNTDINNSVRKIQWINTEIDPLNHDDEKPTRPDNVDDYTSTATIGTTYQEPFKAVEGGVNSDVHAFTFYMGQELRDGDQEAGNNTIYDPFTKTILIDTIARTEIMKEIKKKITLLNNIPSQWKIEQTQGCGCDKKVSLTHIEPAANLDYLVVDINPLLFSESGKLYQVYDDTNTTHWVKGSIEGVALRNEQTHLPNTCYSLTGTDEIIKGSSNPDPHNGRLRVVLDWDKKDINLSLNVSGPTPGIKETHTDYECPRENWYIATDNELQEGHYIVSVNAPANVEESLLPEQIRLDVKAIGKGKYLSLDINDSQLLNIGEVYDIEISKNTTTGHSTAVVRTKVTHATVPYIETAEGSIYTADIFLLFKQLAMGPIAGASLLLEKYITGHWQVLHSGVTTVGSTINSNGLIIFPSTLQTHIYHNDLLLLTASGGHDVDADDDLNMDASSTPVLGKLHAYIDKEQVLIKNLKVNILTEIAYQAVHNQLDVNTTQEELLAMLDDVSKLILKTDLNNDDIISYFDMTSWLASFDKAALKFDYDLKIEPLVQKIYHGEDIYLDVYKLLYAGKVDAISFDENNISTSVRINLNSYTELSLLQKSNFALQDKNGNSFDFTFSLDQNSVIITPTNNFLEGQSYILTFNIPVYDNDHNLFYDHYQQSFTTTDNTPPSIIDDIIHVPENSQYIGINIQDFSTPLTYTVVGGEDQERFETSDNTHLAFKEKMNFEDPADHNQDNTYEVTISIADRFANTTTQSIRIVIDNIQENPLLADTYLSVDEDMPIGTYVGKMTVLNEGDDKITGYTYGSLDFIIDKNGNILTNKVFDYEKLHNYSLYVRAKNSNGPVNSSNYAYITINDVEEPLPRVHNFTGSMDNNASVGKVVGQLYIYPGANTESDDLNIRLSGEGAEDFDVDASGHITVSSTALLDNTIRSTYHLKAVASNSYGESNEASITIVINLWSKQIGTSLRDFPTATAVDKNNNFYMTGELENGYSSNEKSFISKYNNRGERLWYHVIDQNTNIKTTSLHIDDNGTLFVTGAKANGRIDTSHRDTYSPWIMVLSAEGEVLWERTLDNGSLGSDYFETIHVDPTGDLIVAGKTVGAFPGYENTLNNNIFFTKFTRFGDIVWTRQFNIAVSTSHVNAKGEFHILNYTNIIKFDADVNNILWNRRLSIPHVWSGKYIDFTFDDKNNLYLLCQERLYKESNDRQNSSYWYEKNSLVVKYYPSGVMAWKQSYGSEKNEIPKIIKINQNNEIYLAGDTHGNLYKNINKTPYIDTAIPGYIYTDVFLTKIDTNGKILNTKQFGSIYSDHVDSLLIDHNNNIYLASEVNGAVDGNDYYGSSDIFITKIPY